MTKILETSEQYHANLAFGSTTFKKIHESTILHAFQPSKGQTDAMVLGSAVHCAILEPERFGKDFILAPVGAPKKPTIAQINAKKPSEETIASINFWNAFNARAEGKTIIDGDDLEKIMGMKKAVMDHKVAKMMLSDGEAEYSYYSTEQGTSLPLKCRPDYIKNNSLIDLKTTQDASFEGFARQIGNMGYHIQAAHYVDVYNQSTGLSVDEFFFVAVENKAPYAVAIYRLDASQLQAGRVALAHAKNKLADFLARGGNPREPNTLLGFGYPMAIIDIQVPFYMLNKISNDEVA